MNGPGSGALPVVQYWHADELPGRVAELTGTFRDLNPNRRHLVFSREAAADFIAERFGAREATAFRACAVPAMQSDYFSYCAVHALGGLYADVDFRCVMDLAPLFPSAGCGRLFRGLREGIMNGVFAFGSPGHPFLELVVEIATVNIERRLFDDVFHATGPPIFRTVAWLGRYGSLDVLIGRAEGTGFERFVEPYCDAIRNNPRIAHALEGVQIASTKAEHESFIRFSDSIFRCEGSEMHWMKLKGEIYTR